MKYKEEYFCIATWQHFLGPCQQAKTSPWLSLTEKTTLPGL